MSSIDRTTTNAGVRWGAVTGALGRQTKASLLGVTVVALLAIVLFVWQKASTVDTDVPRTATNSQLREDQSGGISTTPLPDAGSGIAAGSPPSPPGPDTPAPEQNNNLSNLDNRRAAAKQSAHIEQSFDLDLTANGTRVIDGCTYAQNDPRFSRGPNLLVTVRYGGAIENDTELDVDWFFNNELVSTTVPKETHKVTSANGTWSRSYDNENLDPGAYRVALSVDGREVAHTNFGVAVQGAPCGIGPK